MSIRNILLPIVVLGGVATLTLWAMQTPQPRPEPNLDAQREKAL